MNLKHPTYARIIEMVQKNEIHDYRTLAIAVGVGYGAVIERAHALEERGRLTRTQSGLFVAIAQPDEPKSGVFERPPVPSLAERNRQRIAQLQAAAAARRAREPNKTPYRPKRRAPVLEAVMEQSEVLLKDAPPDDPELGRLIVETRKPNIVEIREARRQAQAAVAAERLRVLAEAAEREKARLAAIKQAKREAREREKARKKAEHLAEVAARAEARRIAAAERRQQREAQEAEREAARLARRAQRGQGICKFCPHCYDITDNRPKDRPCPGCGEVWARDVIEFSGLMASSIAMFDGQ